MKRILIFLCGGFFYMCLLLLWGRQYTLLQVQAKEIVDLQNGYFSHLAEIEEDSDSILSDSIKYIADVDDELEDLQNDSETDTNYSDGNDVSENQTENAETMNNDDQFKIMIIFCFGLCAGVIVGHFLTGFIK